MAKPERSISEIEYEMELHRLKIEAIDGFFILMAVLFGSFALAIAIAGIIVFFFG